MASPGQGSWLAGPWAVGTPFSLRSARQSRQAGPNQSRGACTSLRSPQHSGDGTQALLSEGGQFMELGASGAKLNWAWREPVCSLLENRGRVWNQAGDAAEGKEASGCWTSAPFASSSPEFPSCCPLGAQSSWFKTRNIKIWPGRALCPVESPKPRALRYHLNYYLLNVFP